jgi:hypothetical protein
MNKSLMMNQGSVYLVGMEIHTLSFNNSLCSLKNFAQNAHTEFQQLFVFTQKYLGKINTVSFGNSLCSI